VETVPERAGAEPVGSQNSEPELWAEVRALPPKQRTAVFCRSVMGMSYAELAELLDCSEDAARRNVHEGLSRLRKEWTP
jgi:RNA polymerase sigma factor (sigma-70 family)